MAEMLELIKSKLMSAIKIDYDENNLIIILNIKGEIQKSDILAEPQEVKDMLQIFGGLKEDIFMKIDVDNNALNIKLKFQTKEDLEKVKKVLEHIWEQIIDLFEELEKGNSSIIRGVGDFTD